MKGILLVDKPSGMTSHDVVDHIRRATGLRRVGHTGTLDPRATGLLILCIGEATRLSEHLTRLDKVYEGAMRLGVTTNSYDLDGQILEEKPVPAVEESVVREACQRFTGEILQVPPMVSAVKVGGERLYKMARHGETVQREPRKVHVYEFDVLDFTLPDIRIRVRCTSGTYVRSLCHEVGQILGCGAALAALRRTAVGTYTLEEATPLEQLDSPEAVAAKLIPIDRALDLPQVTVRDIRRRAVLSGSTLSRRDLNQDCPATEGWVQIKTESGELIALGSVQQTPMGILIHPKRVLVE